MSKNNIKEFIIIGILILINHSLLAQTPVVENVRYEQRTDGSLLVDIWFDVTTVSGLPLEIMVKASNDNGATWDFPCSSLIGDVGEDVTPGANKHIIWDFYRDNPNTSGSGHQIQVTAHCMVCGQTITEDFTLTKDLDCPSSSDFSIKIGAPNVSLDLGGYTISGDVNNNHNYGIYIQDYNGITVKNGTIENFMWSVHMIRSNNSKIQNLNISNLEITDPDITIVGILLGQSRGVKINDVKFEFPDVIHKESIVLGNSNVEINNIEVNGGSQGVHFGGHDDLEHNPSSAIVANSRFTDCTGIAFQYADSTQIIKNVFNRSSINAHPKRITSIRRILIEENEIQNGNIGILLFGVKESIISQNNIKNNAEYGISLMPATKDVDEDITEPFYSTGNIISENIVLGNNIDLHHDEKCVGNTWENNTYETSMGSEIFNYGPSTAALGLTSVDSVVKSMSPDAELLHVVGSNIDTIGRSLHWNYYYKSTIENNYSEFWFLDGKVIDRGILSESWLDDFSVIPKSWINSDSALVISDGMGGKEFRNEFDIESIEMTLQNTNSFFWTVHYIAQDTIFSAYFDASVK